MASLPVSRFSHQAMASPWQLFVASEDEAGAAWAARRAFREVDLLENELSRFRSDSDVGRINGLAAGERTRVGPAAMDCLMLARDVHEATCGAFDVALGALHDCWSRARAEGGRPGRAEWKAARACSGMEQLEIDVEGLSVGVRVDGLVVDFGGVGKGYAADQAAISIKAWEEMDNFLINAGESTVLAVGAGPEGKGWPVSMGDAAEPLMLRDEALSGSGLAVRGAHIIDPRTGKPAVRRKQCWVRADMASVADAFSTAFLILNDKEVAAVCDRHKEIAFVTPAGK